MAIRLTTDRAAVPGRLRFFANKAAIQWTSRWWSVLRYHRPSQLIRRLVNRVRGRLDGWLLRPHFRPPLDLRPDGRPISQAPALPLRRHIDVDFDRLAVGRLTLLNQNVDVGWPIDWRLSRWLNVPKLWKFHLHYHEFLLSLAQRNPSPEQWDTIWGIVLQWIDEHRGQRHDMELSWHPYCISRRLGVWARLLRQRPPAERADAVLSSMAAQAGWLSRRLEKDIGGNHLWENARALLLAGSFFRGTAARRWRRVGKNCLRRCIADQLSPCAEHFERSPLYQLELAWGLLDVAWWLMPVDPVQAVKLQITAGEMETFVDALRHPDGGIPLFGDATLDCDIETCAGHAPTQASGWIGDYYVHADHGTRLIVDAGDMGPDHLPAHAHADLLGFEMSLLGRRVFVDSGVFCYSGPRRAPYRQSSAHNVLTVDDLELADVWSDFRMGRRGHVVQRTARRDRRGIWIRAAHNAYRSRGVRVERIWFVADDGPIFSTHVVAGSGDNRKLCERIHCHPDVTVRKTDHEGVLALEGPAEPLWWEAATPRASVTVAEGSYAPRFYVEQPNSVIELRSTGALPQVMSWAISAASERQRPHAELVGRMLYLSWKNRCGLQRVELNLDEAESRT